tara:strand:+ start:52 stop:639 length:588 start_codon:yes stop_codon:yes gene_type:complete
MSYSDRQFEYEDRNQARFRSLAIHILEHNVQDGTLEIISILEKEKQEYKEIHDSEEKQAAVGIYNQTEKQAYLEFIDREIEHHRELLNWPSSTSQTAQSNETQTTGESVQIEKINWKGNQTQLAYVVQILLENGFIERGDHWKMCAEHFLVKGKPINNKKLAVAMGNVQQFNKDGKPKKAEILESIVSDISSLKN